MSSHGMVFNRPRSGVAMLATAVIGVLLVASIASPRTSFAQSSFTSAGGPILIPPGQPGASSGDASAFPSNILVSGLPSCLSAISVTLSGFQHANPSDLDIALVAPNGASVILMGRAGGAAAVGPINFSFSSGAATTVPSPPVNAGVYWPTDLNAGGPGFNAPGPASRPVNASPPASVLGVFTGSDPNGTWKLFITDRSANGSFGQITSWTLNVFTQPIVVAPVAPASCVTPATPCVDVPVNIALPCMPAPPLTNKIMSYRVRVDLAGGLDLCSGTSSITQGSYLSSVAGATTVYNVSNGPVPNSYIVDCVLLSGTPPNPCGQNLQNGTLFTVKVKSTAGGSGTGTVTTTLQNLFDCDGNDLVPVLAMGAPVAASVPFASVTPSITNLTAAYVGNGNGPPTPSSLSRIDLTWTATNLPAGVNIYRMDFGPNGYNTPNATYGSACCPPAASVVAPTAPAACPTGPLPPAWILVNTVAPVVGNSFSDNFNQPAGVRRGQWFYIACAAPGNPCAADGPILSNMTTGTLNYHLGDFVGGPNPPNTGDHLVNVADLSALSNGFGGQYFAAPIPPSFPPYDPILDIGSNPPPAGPLPLNQRRPTPDGKIDFFDLVVFGVNYNKRSVPSLAISIESHRAQPGNNTVWVDAPNTINSGETFDVLLRVNGVGDIQGLLTQLSWDGAVANPVAGSVVAGDLMIAQDGAVLSAGHGDIAAVMLGERNANDGMTGEGIVARVTFQAIASGDPAVGMASLDARNHNGEPITLTALGVDDGNDKGTLFFAATPNPFQNSVNLSFRVAQRGPVELAIYSVDGRRVKTVVDEVKSAGLHSVVWNGADESGARVQPGVFFARLVNGNNSLRKAITFLR